MSATDRRRHLVPLEPPRAETTLSLLDRANSGDRQAFDELFSRCVPALQRWASGRLPRTARGMTETADVVQDAVLNTLRQLSTFVPEREGSLQAYLRRAVMNRIRDELRRVARRPTDQLFEEYLGESDAPSPLDQAIGREAVERYERALARLAPIEREAIIARLELGYTYEQVAEAVGRPSPDAARVALRRALVRLAQEMARDS
jgi:RNA polymerase sigma-70 factor (ECF subfamily)